MSDPYTGPAPGDKLPPVEPAPPPAPAGPLESRGERISRKARRIRLYTWSILLAAGLIVVVALVLANTQQVRVNWVFGHSTASLVWLVIIPAIAGWIVGMATSILFRRRTRAPRR